MAGGAVAVAVASGAANGVAVTEAEKPRSRPTTPSSATKLPDISNGSIGSRPSSRQQGSRPSTPSGGSASKAVGGLDPKSLGRVQSTPVIFRNSSERENRELRKSNAKWAQAFDNVDSDLDGRVTHDQAAVAFRSILGQTEGEIPNLRIRKEFDVSAIDEKIDFASFHALVKSVSTHMANHSNWRDMEHKAELQEMQREKEQRDARRRQSQDLFNILGLDKSKDLIKVEAKKNQALERTTSSSKLSLLGNQVMDQNKVVRRARFAAQGKRATISDVGQAASSGSTSVAALTKLAEGGGVRFADQTSNLKRIKTIDLASDIKELNFKGYGSACFSLRFSPDGSRLAGGYFDGNVRIFDTARTSQQLYTLNVDKPWTSAMLPEQTEATLENMKMPEENSVTNLRWFPSSKKNILATIDIGGTIAVWDLTKGRDPKLVSKTPGVTELSAMAFTSDRKRLLVAGQQKIINVFDFPDSGGSSDELKMLQSIGSQVSVLDKTIGHSAKIVSLCSDTSNPDIVVTGALDKRVLIWDLRTDRGPVGAVKGVEVAGDSLDLSEDGKTLLAASHRTDQVIQFFDLRQLGADQPVEATHSFNWSGAVAKAGAAESSPDDLGCMAFNASWDRFGKTIAVAGEKDPIGQVFRRRKDDSDGLEVVGAVACRGTGAMYAATVSEDGRNAAFGGSDGFVQVCPLGR